MNILGIFGSKQKSSLKLVKSEGQQWAVKNTYGVLYLGTKEMCRTFMQNYALA